MNQQHIRAIGSLLLIVGYAVTLNLSMVWGITIQILGQCLISPFFISKKMWDVVFTTAIFFALNVSALSRFLLAN